MLERQQSPLGTRGGGRGTSLDVWEGGEGVTEDETVGRHHRLSGHELEQTPGDGGVDSLACSLWGHRVGHDLATEQPQTLAGRKPFPTKNACTNAGPREGTGFSQSPCHHPFLPQRPQLFSNWLHYFQSCFPVVHLQHCCQWRTVKVLSYLLLAPNPLRPPGLCKGRAKILTTSSQEALYVLPLPYAVHFLTILPNNLLLILSRIQLHWATCDASNLPDVLLTQGLLPGIISDSIAVSSLPTFSSLVKLIFLVSPPDQSVLILNSTSIMLSYFPPALTTIQQTWWLRQ